ncbi:hypothetical protein SETIT_9G167100v2 [Setaria italica]|uniref:TF-B3 domain-containing protein n=1 Tax=Setaria italica TaxID=4555 RepID=A0A368SHL1_SETIT|nr:B3 domain-containing protein Os03g0619600 [Setaria italica]RCV41844.1 hypothetical protein SETIT_9G167100v2 [Setaria italica]
MARTRSGGSRMKKPCKCCRRYLDHLEGKNQPMSYFFRRVDANSRHRMIIPNRFVKRFAGKLSRIINLESPNGGLYDVEVKERYNKTVLQRGWEAFVDANRVQENDFLLFHHIEKSRFEVLILGSDGCEKVFPCAGVRNTPSIQERSLDSVDISSSSCHETTESSESERFARCGRSSSSHRRRMAATSSSFEESGEDTPSRNKSFESGDDLQTPPRDGYVLSCRRYLSEAQKGKVIALIQKIKPEVTVFVSIMRKSNVQTSGAYLVISKEYALAHFPHETTFLTLQRPGKSKKWHPRFYIRNDRRVYMLRGQWLDFVRDNHVQEGDICLLLPAKSGRKFMLTVYLLRATDTCPRGGSGTVGFPRVGPFHDRSSAEMTSVVHIKEESTDGEHVSSESSMKEVSDGSLNSNDSGGPSEELTDGEHVSSESSMKEFSEASLNSNDSGGPSDPPYILPAMSCLSKSQKKIVEAKVRAIQSEVPIYVVIMKRTSVDVTHNKMLEFGTQYAAAHLPVREQTMVLQCNAKIWNTKMEIRNGHRLFLRVGWPEFVRDNSLRVGDICLFELKKNERELTMEVQIISREQF